MDAASGRQARTGGPLLMSYCDLYTAYQVRRARCWTASARSSHRRYCSRRRNSRRRSVSDSRSEIASRYASLASARKIRLPGNTVGAFADRAEPFGEFKKVLRGEGVLKLD